MNYHEFNNMITKKKMMIKYNKMNLIRYFQMKINRKKKILFLKIKKINIKIKKLRKYLKIIINLNNKKRNKFWIKKLNKMKKKFNLQKILILHYKIKNK